MNKSHNGDIFQLHEKNMKDNENMDLAARFKELEEQMRLMRQFLADSKNQSVNGNPKRRNIAGVVADRVDSVVGLKEALTWRHRPLQVIWALLLIFGLSATTYYIYKNTDEYMNGQTTTKVTLEKSVSYEFPPLVVCPPWWFNFDQVKSMGLSKEAITYSIGYGNLFQTYMGENNANLLDNMTQILYNEQSDIKNRSKFNQPQPKTELSKFYSENNFSSAVDYYKAIAVNISDTYYIDDNLTQPINTLILDYCIGCNNTNLYEKTVFWNSVCYLLNLNKSTAIPTSLLLTNFDNSSGILNRTFSDWKMDFLPNVAPSGPSIILKPYKTYSIKIGTQRIMMLPNDSACVDRSSKENSNYYQRICNELCFSNISFTDGGKYKSFLSGNFDQIDNIFDTVLEVAMDIQELNDNATSYSNDGKNVTVGSLSEDKINQMCYDKCLPTCDRNIYDFTVESTNMEGEKNDGVSIIELNIKHQAVFRGGIETWQEVAKTSFGEFVANVGGTLGVFLGCTVMTFAQIVLSMIEYAIGGRSARKVN